MYSRTSRMPRVAETGGFFERSQQFQQNAIQAQSMMRPNSKTEMEAPGKTVGGGIGAGAGMGMAGYMAAGAVKGGIGGGMGAAIGAGVGLLSYIFS